MKYHLILAALVLAVAASEAKAADTEVMYLSGKDADDPVEWQFRCSEGMNSGKWTTIGVPSCWEQQGFGAYTYGRFYLDKKASPSSETGEYRRTFDVPADWWGKTVRLVFEGVMTDASVKINGKSAGDVHQGAFTAFSYDISRLLKYGKENTIDVFVKKESDNKSVNAAERRADWWLFGGIYRPVYLEVLPAKHISKVMTDAKADGTLNLRLTTSRLPAGASLTAEIDGAQTQVVGLSAGSEHDVSFSFGNVKRWDPEHPNLYNLRLTLKDSKGREIHSVNQKVGFRTLEFMPRDGFYLNGTRLVMKGVNRHCFYPETGRATSRSRDLEDVRLLKGMNANAIRSHYQPDRHLLELCDSLGLLYFDELAGWQDPYDNTVGPKILTEMIEHDANHPSVFAWGNGNEGGFNYSLLPLYEQLDIQGRKVAHPWSLKDGLDTHHYPAYQTGVARFVNGYQVFMPTEFLHSQFDKGGGASLDEFWANWSQSPLFAGGFIWAMVDEGVMRTDIGKIDTNEGNAPDGIVGPHREKEGSWYTIRDVWSPLQIAPLTVRRGRVPVLNITNRSLFSSLGEYSLCYEVLAASLDKGEKVLASGRVDLKDAMPGEAVNVGLGNSGDFSQGDFLRLTFLDSKADTVNVSTYPMLYADEFYKENIHPASAGKASVEGYTLKSGDVTAEIDPATGYLSRVTRGGRVIPFGKGPVPVGMKMSLSCIQVDDSGDTAKIIARYKGAVDSIVWSMTPDGQLGLDILMLKSKNGNGYEGEFVDKTIRNFGFSFSYPEELCTGMTWVGKGPYRVWRNRRRGTNYGLWHKDYNNTVTGQWDEGSVYPEFKGYHANIYEARVESEKSPFTVRSETDGLYLRMFTPEEPRPGERVSRTMTPFPEGDVSFLLDIPPIRSYKPLEQLGPGGIAPNVRINKGDDGIRLKLWLDFSE